ncbi:MAG: yycJ [Cyanobacteria bacterium RYN_339]|nr:yycJ [Cyanobacteria bacterium RYN_339]
MAFHLQMFRSGSSGNCSLLTVGSTRLLIDAGIGPRSLAKELAVLGLNVRDLTAAVFTHSHSDHLRANTMLALAREGVPMYMNEGTLQGARRREGRGDLERLPAGMVRHFDAERPFELKGLQLTAFQVDHGAPGPDNHAGDPVGFVMTDGRDTFGYCTDIGHVTLNTLMHLKAADLLVFECNHDIEMARLCARPWNVKQWILGDYGHLNNVQCATALAQLFEGREGVGVVLAHLSEQCNTVGMARETTREALAEVCEAVVGVATRHSASQPWVLDGGRARPLELEVPC